MKYCGFGFLKYILLVASLLGLQVAGEEKQYGEIYNDEINKTVESHLWNITDFNIPIPHNNSLEYEKREPCEYNYCFNGGKCKVENGTEICDCKRGYIGVECETACDCGDAPCELDANGFKKECNCTEKQILYENKCVDCDCGNGTCMLHSIGFSGLTKKCLCGKDQGVHEGKCVDCDCGEKSRGCYFDFRGMKKCYCQPGSAHFEGTCKDCNCGRYFRCSFHENGTMDCHCSKGFSQRNNTCHVNCEGKKDCSNGGICRKEEDGGYFCKCREGFSGNKCLIDDICNSMRDKCKAMGGVCILSEDGDLRLCECRYGQEYNSKSGMCEDICDERRCNHGTCKLFGGESFSCSCYPGFKGFNCDQIDDRPDINLKTTLLVILIGAILVFFIVTLCLIQRNKKLLKSLQQKTSVVI